MIRIDGLTVRYGTLVAVNAMTLDIPKGEIFGLVGPNGAGKTTTLKVIAGLLPPDGGTVRVGGQDVVSARDTVRARIGYMADFFGVYDYLTVHEYLAFFGGMYGAAGPALETHVQSMLETVNLLSKREAFVGTLSRGMKQRLYFARALLHQPELLVLDEPASGLDPRGRTQLFQTLRQLHHEGRTILISSHILSELEDLVTSVGIMEAGRLVGSQSLRPAGEQRRRRAVVLNVMAEDMARAAALLEQDPRASCVQQKADRIVFDTDDDDTVVAALVRDLVSRQIRLLLPRMEGADLSDIFLKMTKGELM